MTRIGNGGEQDLVRDIQRGDRVAMKLLYCRYAGCLTAVCSRYVACMDDVRDVLQDCFVKIFTSIHGFEWRGEGSLRGWMVRIVVNESLKFLKRNRQLESLGDGWDVPDTVEDEPDETVDGSPEENADVIGAEGEDNAAETDSDAEEVENIGNSDESEEDI